MKSDHASVKSVCIGSIHLYLFIRRWFCQEYELRTFVCYNSRMRKKPPIGKKNIFLDVLLHCSRYATYLLILLLPTQLGKHFFFSFSFVSGVRVDYLAPTIYAIDFLLGLLLLLHARYLLTKFFHMKFLLLLLFLFLNTALSTVPLLSLYASARLMSLIGLYFILKKEHFSLKTVLLLFTVANLS